MELSSRVIPCLLLRGAGLVKTTKFREPVYLGEPCNVIKIFNEKEVDEIVVLDIEATATRRGPTYELLEELAGECFMPLAYGGGVDSVEVAQRVLKLGAEKVVFNSAAYEKPDVISDAASRFGSQSIVVSMDVGRKLLGGYEVMVQRGQKGTGMDPVTYALRMEEKGAGELLVNSIERDGTMQGYDLRLIQAISKAVKIPVIACGGAGSVTDLAAAIKEGGASAVAAGSLFVFHGRHRAVLISFPSRKVLVEALC